MKTGTSPVSYFLLHAGCPKYLPLSQAMTLALYVLLGICANEEVREDTSSCMDVQKIAIQAVSKLKPFLQLGNGQY